MRAENKLRSVQQTFSESENLLDYLIFILTILNLTGDERWETLSFGQEGREHLDVIGSTSMSLEEAVQIAFKNDIALREAGRRQSSKALKWSPSEKLVPMDTRNIYKELSGEALSWMTSQYVKDNRNSIWYTFCKPGCKP